MSRTRSLLLENRMEFSQTLELPESRLLWNTATSRTRDSNRRDKLSGFYKPFHVKVLQPKGKYVLGVFVDIKGAFDCALFQTCCDVALCYAIAKIALCWSRCWLLLDSRSKQGYSLDDVLSLLLQSVLADSLLYELQNLLIHDQPFWLRELNVCQLF